MKTRFASPLLAVAAVLVLSACAAGGGRPGTTTPEPASDVQDAPLVAAAVTEPAAAVEAEPGAEAAPVSEAEPGSEAVPVSEAVIETAIAALTPDEPVEPDIDDDPAQVLDLDDAALEALLGAPSFTRRETGVQVWQYAGADCVLDVYLYNDGPATPYRVTYFEIRTDGAGGKHHCFRNMLLARLAG